MKNNRISNQSLLKDPNNCGCFFGGLFASAANGQRIQTIEKGHLEEVKFKVLDWQE